MASGSSPHHLAIHNTSATEGGQNFAGINLGTIHYANGNEPDVNDVLKSLPIAADAPFSAYHRQHDPTCLRNTRVDLLREIYEWIDGEGSPAIFWLSGLAGTGKSTVAQTVAAEFSAKGRLAGSFFFSRAGGDVSHAGKFVTTLAYQLANFIPALRRKICGALSKRNDITSQSLNDQWQELFLGPLSNLDDIDGRSTYVLVVDALDECEDQINIQIILQLLADVQSLNVIRLRVLLTSRPEVPIQYGFNELRRDKHQDFVLHDIEPSIIDHDVSVFLRHELGLIGQKCQLKDGWPEERAIQCLVQNSGGLFIWAATACRFVGQHSQLAETRLTSLLQEENSMLPPQRKLDEIYTTVLTISIQGEYDETEHRMLHKLFRQAVGPIVTLLDPLSVNSLAELLGKDVETLRRTLTNLNSVLDVSETKSNTIRLLHPSLRDFLLDRRRCLNPQFHIEEQLVHREMYKCCLKVMSKHLRRDICNLRHPGACISDLGNIQVDTHIQPHIQYACRFWVHHYKRSGMDAGGCYDIEIFLQEHFLHWLESLALLNCISDAVFMIHMLGSMFIQKEQTLRVRLRDKFLSSLSLKNKSISTAPKEPPSSDLQALVHDATRFILMFRPILEVAPLQVYYAGLVFSPNRSIVKKTFSNEVPPWFRVIPNVLENWSSCFQTLKGHSRSVNDVAFSPDGKTLASASYDHMIKLWDTGSGKALQTLKGHSDEVNAVAFSPDGKTLASASDDDTIKLWDTGSGKALQTLKGHSNSVSAVAFSPDGKMLASASYDHTIKLWDAGSRKALQTLKGHLGKVRAVAFSPDGKTLASASGDNTIKLWDAGSRKALQTLKGHSSSVSAVAFSPDGKTLASASDDCTVKLWDAGSGKALQTLKGHSNRVNSVAFSPDGKTLASASDDCTVKLWDAGSGKALQTLDYDVTVTILLFSDDGSCLWTNRGAILVADPSKDVDLRRTTPPLMFAEKEWIYYKGERLLWLPSEYRSEVVTVHGSILGFGYSSGRVLLLPFVL